MSVFILDSQEIIKVSNTLSQQPLVQDFVKKLDFFKQRNEGLTETPETFIGRAVWYACIANVTAFNVQYKENEPIDFDMDGDEDFDTLGEAVDSLRSLLYNCYTNDGNSFLSGDWMEALEAIKKEFKDVMDMQYANYHF
tara:strand:+ start:488 stop:904 length:417 start_codon:yes stop_codon:yes gene_type:complete